MAQEVLNILDEINYLYYLAQNYDREFDRDSYIWIVGVDVYRVMIAMADIIHTEQINDAQIVNKIRGICIEKIDNENPTRISLYKAVK